jgi:hypothetical protein
VVELVGLRPFLGMVLMVVMLDLVLVVEVEAQLLLLEHLGVEVVMVVQD